METELIFSLQIFRGTKQAEVVVIRHHRVLIGSGAHCDIRLDDVGSAREHAELEVEGDQVIARALSYVVPPLMNGAPLVGASKLEQGAEIAILGTRIVVSVVREVNPNAARSPARRILTSIGIACALLIVPVAVYAALNRGGDEPIGPPPPPTPLWTAPITACKFEAPDQAGHYAVQMRSLGDVNRERYPFDIQDGINAVSAYEMAAACHRKAGRNDEAGIDAELTSEIRDVVESDYFAHRIRLEHAIESNDAKAAYLEVKILRKLTANLKGAYIDWLNMVERRLEFSLREVVQEKTGI
ncbi:hypothetical protein BH11MYX4_BH11MYX4_24000 [soil metagenome]